MFISSNLTISYTDPICKSAAIKFAKQQQLTCVPPHRITSVLTLNFTPNYIELLDNENNNRIHVDFLSGSIAHRNQFGGGKGQAIAKAIGLKNSKSLPTVLDGTAGLARDAYVIASLGCPVTMLEQSVVVAKLVSDGIERADYNEDFKKILNTGFILKQKNCLEYFVTLSTMPDVIYLDPMYPDKKKSALVKKNMQLLQKLLGADEDTTQLLEESLRYAKNRVVVKRPKGAEAIPGRTPDTRIESKKTRYDVYLTFNN